MTHDILKTVVREEAVLEKFDGEVGVDENVVLRERVTLVDGEIVKHEYFDEEGVLTNLVEGGNNGTNNSIP